VGVVLCWRCEKFDW